MWTKAFWAACAERAVKTFAQSAVAFLAGAATGLFNADWVSAVSVAGMATVLSFLTSLASDGLTGNGPSLTNSEVVVDTPAAPPAAP